jgi:predicted mannosyl-3-phosphoglycerate phosphatase (HAD superfamily)
MQDRFLNSDNAFNRLLKEYREHSKLLVAFDFDNTIFDIHNDGDTFPALEQLLKDLKSIGCSLILFTCRTGTELEEAITYCTVQGYPPDFVNESTMFSNQSVKPFFNMLLDDRAGLKESYEHLTRLVKTVRDNQLRIQRNKLK